MPDIFARMFHSVGEQEGKLLFVHRRFGFRTLIQKVTDFFCIEGYRRYLFDFDLIQRIGSDMLCGLFQIADSCNSEISLRKLAGMGGESPRSFLLRRGR